MASLVMERMVPSLPEKGVPIGRCSLSEPPKHWRFILRESYPHNRHLGVPRTYVYFRPRRWVAHAGRWEVSYSCVWELRGSTRWRELGVFGERAGSCQPRRTPMVDKAGEPLP